MVSKYNWRQHAKCFLQRKPINDFYPEERNRPRTRAYRAEIEELRDYCAGCPVKDLCLASAMEHLDSINHGVFAGTTPEERRQLAGTTDPERDE